MERSPRHLIVAVDFDSLVIGPTIGIFGEPIIYTPVIKGPMLVQGTPVNITGVFDEGHLDVSLNAENTPVSTAAPILGIQKSALDAANTAAGTASNDPAENDFVYIPRTDTYYIVKDPQPDGHGHFLLRLSEMDHP